MAKPRSHTRRTLLKATLAGAGSTVLLARHGRAQAEKPQYGGKLRVAYQLAPGALDPLTKEMIYIAVSVAQSCEYCIRSHTAAARAKGMTDAQFMELIGVVGMAAETNRLALAMQTPVDEAFK